MSDWLIKRIAAATRTDIMGGWPERQTYTVQNMRTGEIKQVTCCGSSQVEGLISAGRFDEELTVY
jgi:hypothetical protein